MTTVASGKVKSLKVSGLLSFGEETTFEFGKLNLLVGPNGSGKSNLLECLRIFKNCPTDVQQTFTDGGFREWTSRHRGNLASELELRVSYTDAQAIRHLLILSPYQEGASLDETVELRSLRANRDHVILFQSDRDPGPTDEMNAPFPNATIAEHDLETGRWTRRSLKSGTYEPLRSVLSQIRDAHRYWHLMQLVALYSGMRIYSEASFGRQSVLRNSAATDRSDPRLSESMDDLPIALNALQGTEAHDKIRRYLHELKESYTDYITRVAFGRIGLELREAPFDKPLPAKRLSDGTLRFLALAAILLHPDPSPLICIEEPELGMHPDMIRMVANMIVDASTRTQLIITTHSEHLLTALQDDFAVLFAFDAGERGTLVRSFNREDFKAWREEHSLGSLWTAGELGGNRW